MIVCKSEKIKPDNKNFVDYFTHEILRIYSKIKKEKRNREIQIDRKKNDVRKKMNTIQAMMYC